MLIDFPLALVKKLLQLWLLQKKLLQGAYIFQ